ncbi:InlB B-repeat-containing protein [Alkalibacter saccharofermentans]|nr:InlB B-repeat-containing protein [Alkalibacter saccharofermentans]
MKKKMAIILGGVILMGFVLAAVVFASQNLLVKTDSDGYLYTVRGEKASIKGYEGERTILEIPDAIETEKGEIMVKDIGRGAFSENETLEMIVIGENIESIGSLAFSDCSSLKKVEFMGDAPAMGKDVFAGCHRELVLLFEHGKTGYSKDEFGYDAQPFFRVYYEAINEDSGDVPEDGGRYGEGEEVVVLDNSGNLTRMGHTFNGWTANPDGSKEAYQEGEIIVMPGENLILHPNWKINKYEITFHSNGGDKIDAIEVEYDNLIPEPEKIQKKGFVFIDWFRDKDLKDKWDFTSSKVKEEVELYAKWFELPKTPTGLRASTHGYDQISLAWNKSGGAESYEIFRSDSSQGDYKKIGETKTAAYTDKGLSYQKTYYYKVRAKSSEGDISAQSEHSKSASAKAELMVPGGFAASRHEPARMRVSWNRSVGATGYEIYRSDSPSGNFTLLTKTTSTSYVDPNGTWNKGNYYRVRSYRTVGGKDVYSGYTSVKGYGRVGDALGSYLSSSSNRTSVNNATIRLNGGHLSNACVYFTSEAMRRVGVPVRTSMRNIDYLLPYLYENGWKKERDYTRLRKGDLCFTTDAAGNKDGRPTHVYTFMGWVEEGNYEYAYICDNQAPYYDNKVLHIRNFLNPGEHDGSEKEAFSYFLYNR